MKPKVGIDDLERQRRIIQRLQRKADRCRLINLMCASM